MKFKRCILLFLALFLAAFLCACFAVHDLETAAGSVVQYAPGNEEAGAGQIDSGEAAKQPPAETSKDGLLNVAFLYVGNGDCAVISTPDGYNMLIDAGNPGSEKEILGYLKKNGVSHLNAVVATHPHNDHIGGMREVLEAITWDEIYMPDSAHTTDTYINLLKYIKKEGKTISRAKAGVSFDLGEYVSVTFIAPGKDEYKDLNNVSAVCRIDYKDVSFLFTGDAETESEKEMLEGFFGELSADVLKVAHHGSKSSTSKKFLNAVSPSIAVISCGEDNDYGHPHKKTIDRLKKAGAAILRTDDLGNVKLVSDGENVFQE